MIDKNKIKEFGLNCQAKGAWVKDASGGIIGLEKDAIMVSSDADSLYPTVMIFSNIGHDTLYGKMYNLDMLEGVLNALRKSIECKDPEFYKELTEALMQRIKRWYDNTKNKKTKKDLFFYNEELIYALVSKLSDNANNLEEIMSPVDDRTYILHKSYLIQILEIAQNSHPDYNFVNTAFLDLFLMKEDDFENKYKDKMFLFNSNCFSSKSKLSLMNFNEVKDQILSKYLLNIYGTVFYTHADKKSFYIDMIINGRNVRKDIKGNKISLIKEIENAGDNVSKELVDKFFENGFNQEDLENLPLLQAFLTRLSNAIKIMLNSQYGVYGLSSWYFSNYNISNSITVTGQMLIKCCHITSKYIIEEKNLK